VDHGEEDTHGDKEDTENPAQDRLPVGIVGEPLEGLGG
jgi:hypothetical protein